jgi:integrase
MVLKAEDPDTENYFDLRKSKFVFNKYKTAAAYGTQEVAIPPALKKILQKWIKHIPDGVEYLLFNSKKEPLTAVTLNQRLNEIFGGPKGINSLRHYYLTQNHAETIRGEDRLADDMVQMGSKISQARNYIKVYPKNDIEAKV